MDSPIINRLERRLGRFAIPHAIRIMAGFQGLMWLLLMINPHLYEALRLSAPAILQGEVWRLVTFLFIPMGGGILTIIAVLFLWFIGEGLEQAWGAFKVNLYLLTVVVAMFWANYLFDAPGVGLFVKSGLIMAFAGLFPNHTIMLMLVIPIKMKWVGWIAALTCLLYFWGGPAALRMTVVASLLPFAVFVLPAMVRSVASEAKASARRREFQLQTALENDTFHRCVECSITEREDEHMEFRVAANGDEYCLNCLHRAEAPQRDPGREMSRGQGGADR